jgi:hypothetical protein
MIRRGLVSSIDATNKLARVYFPESGSVSKGMRYTIPIEVNDEVIVAFTDQSDGAIISNLSRDSGGGGGGGGTYVHHQIAPDTTWVIAHNLDRHPTVTIVDSAGSVVVGDVQYLDSNTVLAQFNAAFSGKAYLN